MKKFIVRRDNIDYLRVINPKLRKLSKGIHISKEELNLIINLGKQDFLIDESDYRYFNVGDIVICCEKLYELDKNESGGGSGWEKGSIFKITEFSFSDKIAWGTKNGNGVYINYLRPATQEEIEKYKNGK